MVSEGGYHLKQGSRLAIFMVIIDDKVPSMLGCLFSWFCSVPQLKTPSQHLRLHGATPGPVWRRQQASRILWPCHLWKMHQEHNGKHTLIFD